MDELNIPPRPANALAVRRAIDLPGFEPLARRHQPWLPGAAPLPVPDDFSRSSATAPLAPVALALLLAALVLAAGRSGQMVDAAYGLDTFAGSEAVIGAAEGWHAAMSWLGIPDALDALHGALGLAE